MFARQNRANREAQRGSPLRMMAYRRLPLFFALGALLGWQMRLRAPHPWTWLQTAGLGMVVVGLCFWPIAHIQLGASFSLKPEARALVTRGLYSKIRNPIYVFGALR
jgi:protein-S-isoprenylcysteine O-methyltransferase Ste14